MKKWLLLFVLSLIIIPFSMHARPKVEVAPRATLYISSVNFGIGGDLIVNMTDKFGLRFTGAEIMFGDDNTTFVVNQSALYMSSMEALIYFPLGDFDSYANAGFGLMTTGDYTMIMIGGGLGITKEIKGAGTFFVEPSLFFIDNYDSDVMFRISGGMRFDLL